jgi:hypothetical protein
MIFLLFWALLLFFLMIKKEIKAEERIAYQKKLFILVVVLAVIDIILTIIVYFQAFFQFFHLKRLDLGQNEAILSETYSPLLVIVLLLLAILIALFILFILKRSIRILQQYWISLLLLIITSLMFTILSGIINIGWYEESHPQILLFSLSYTYVAWIFLSFIFISIFCNTASILLYPILTKFVNPVKFKHLIISFLKMGFTTSIAFSLLVVMPDIILWLYS